MMVTHVHKSQAILGCHVLYISQIYIRMYNINIPIQILI